MRSRKNNKSDTKKQNQRIFRIKVTKKNEAFKLIYNGVKFIVYNKRGKHTQISILVIYLDLTWELQKPIKK